MHRSAAVCSNTYVYKLTFNGKPGGVCSLTFNFTTEIQCTTTLVPIYHKHTQVFSSNRFITNCIQRGEYRHGFIQVPGRIRHSATTCECCCCIMSYVQCICSKRILDLYPLPTRTTCKIIIRNLPAVWITDITVAVNARRIFTACEAIFKEQNCTTWGKPAPERLAGWMAPVSVFLLCHTPRLQIQSSTPRIYTELCWLLVLWLCAIGVDLCN